MNSSMILALLALICFGFSKAEDSSKGCDTLGKCLNEAYTVRKSCDVIEAEIDQKYPPKNATTQEEKDIETWTISYNNLTYFKRMEKINCLNQKVATNQTVVCTCDKHKEAECNKRIEEYKPRSKRQASAPVTVPAPVGAAPASAQLTVSQLTQDISSDDQKIKQERAQAAQLEKEKAEELAAANTAAKKATAAVATPQQIEYNNMHKSLSDCNAKAAAIEADCGRLAECCSEDCICDWAFEIRAEYKEWIELTRKLTVARRAKSCPVPKAG